LRHRPIVAIDILADPEGNAARAPDLISLTSVAI
jgi:hypothetical protein